MSYSDRFDALILGGGPAGSASALLLARAGWSVALVERKEFPRRKVCGEYLSATNLPLLEELGVAQAFYEQAGPAVRKVGLFAGETVITADLPRPRGIAEWGRALSRERLDTLLLQSAQAAGAVLFQPWSATSLAQRDDGYACRIEPRGGGDARTLAASVVLAAHGSWEPGGLPTQAPHGSPRPGDLFGFKAHFRESTLPPALMPLLAFPGGYGGMVHTDAGRVSLSCCVRQDRLRSLRSGNANDAGDAVLGHIERSCRGVREALVGAIQDGPWMAAGPIRPGIRLHRKMGVFPVGNVAGEAHPVVAEGISMALQGAGQLAQALGLWRDRGAMRHELAGVHREYATAWRRRFAARVHVAAAIAQWAMRPRVLAPTLPFLRRWPQLLHWGARLSGKDHDVARVLLCNR